MKKTDLWLSDFPPVSPKEWKQKIIEELKGKPFEDIVWRTKEGREVQPFYTVQDLEKAIAIPKKTKPGWEIRQDIEVKDVKDANKNALEALSSGAESIGFDLSKVPVTKSNLQKLLAGIDLEKYPVHFKGMKMKSLEKFVSVFTKKTLGSVEFADFSEKDNATLSGYLKKFPAFDFITIKTPSLQRIFHSPFIHKKRVRISVALSCDYFLEIARLRAIRLFFSEKNIPVFIHSENIPQKNTKGEEHYHILRATTTAMAAIIGGCDSLSLKASAIPGKSKDFSERIYRNIQLLLKYESHLNMLNDSASGSYYLDTLTLQLLNQYRQVAFDSST